MAVQIAKNAPHMIVWEIHSSLDLTTIYKNPIDLPIKENISLINVTACFDSNGEIYLLQSDGSVWHVMS